MFHYKHGLRTRNLLRFEPLKHLFKTGFVIDNFQIFARFKAKQTII
jgi:hypothetical protein